MPQHLGSTSTPTLPIVLKRRWWAVVLLFVLATVGGFLLLSVGWHPTAAMEWGMGTSGALLYLLGYTRIHLALNRRHADASVLPQLGAGNVLTLVRGLLYGFLAGFVVLPMPSELWAYVPGALFTAASLTDFVDGWVARRRGETTKLGAKLDVEVDSMGVLVAYILAVQLGQLPTIFVGMGGLFYTYRLALWGRRRCRRPVYPLPDDPLRSVIGGFQAGVLCVILWPVFSPPLTTLATTTIATIVLFSFVRDWLVATGRLDARSDVYRSMIERWHRVFVQHVPVLVRSFVGVVSLYYVFATEWTAFTSLLSQGLVAGTVAAGVAVAAGVGGRAMSLALLTASAFASLRMGDPPALMVLVLGALILMMTGLGTPSTRYRMA